MLQRAAPHQSKRKFFILANRDRGPDTPRLYFGIKIHIGILVGIFDVLFAVFRVLVDVLVVLVGILRKKYATAVVTNMSYASNQLYIALVVQNMCNCVLETK